MRIWRIFLNLKKKFIPRVITVLARQKEHARMSPKEHMLEEKNKTLRRQI